MTISFSIDGNNHEALPGMTWKAWCESSYNTGFWLADEFTEVVCESDYYIVLDDIYVKPSDFIIPNTGYMILFNNSAID